MIEKNDIISAGYKLSYNAGESQVIRAVKMTKTAYLNPLLGDGFEETDAVKAAWCCLAFVHLLRDDFFAVQSGGEVKLFDNGSKPSDLRTLKSEAAHLLKAIGYGKKNHVVDYLDIFFKTQLTN
jgi:hypothetical protein